MLNKKQDNFAVMATGYGKSLLYQFPAIYSRGTTLVISPLISLMQNQALSLSVANISACLLGSAQAHPAATIEGILNNNYSIVYLTPKFCWLRKQLLYEIKKRCRLVLIAVDEVHCEIFVDVPVLAVTVTATKNVYEDIISVLKLQNRQVICPGFDRPNLYFKVRPKEQSVLRDLQEDDSQRWAVDERSRLASINGCMPYMGASDTILTSMFRYPPRIIVELRKLGIEGLTEARMSKFMPQFLRFINNIDNNAITNFEIEEETIFEMEQDNDYEYYDDDDDNADDYYDDNSDAIFETEIFLMEENFDDVLMNDDKNEILMALCDRLNRNLMKKSCLKLKR
ncbi:unnamed protein product [Ceutorhynchus assimilis]|uniref:Helicase ATP-binding domain-containing protein n=1 Tax=Ceutorhynchus assimilis TaxID=467358 RepID=A0A9N9QR77_9CUCU|nr:unnamed protein product [Ceutorhynchus assimilis]